MSDLFGYPSGYQPLAARMRPRNLDDYIGQEHLLGAGKPLREAIVRGHLQESSEASNLCLSNAAQDHAR